MNCVGDCPATISEDQFNIAFILLCTILVVAMQLGFAMLEVGSVREAHRNTVLVKNLLDSTVSCLAFAASCSVNPISIVLDANNEVQRHLMLLQWSYCAACVTIVSGSMAERTHMIPYLCYSAVMSAVVYPLLANSAWGSDNALLRREFHGRVTWGYSYHDFAGGGIVHITGGIAALVGNMMLGRRIRQPDPFGSLEQEELIGMSNGRDEDGLAEPKDSHLMERGEDYLNQLHGELPRRFDKGGVEEDDEEFQSCSYLQVLGTLTLWFGWYGFNTGSALLSNRPGSRAPGLAAWNTTLSACCGGLGAFINLRGLGRNLDAGFLCNGVLAGLVTVTAGCDVFQAWAAIVGGFAAGLIIFPGFRILLRHWRLDDPVDAISVHAGCGTFGVILAGLSIPDCTMKEGIPVPLETTKRCASDYSSSKQFVAQLWGVFTIMWATAVVTLLLWGVFALSERVQAREAEVLKMAQRLSTAAGDGSRSSEARREWRYVHRMSPLARRILAAHGWQGNRFQVGAPADFEVLREALRAAEVQVQSGLESRTSWLMDGLVRCLVQSALLRQLAVVRLRISPSAEISGVGSSAAGGGHVLRVIRSAMVVLAELRQTAVDVNEPLKKEVRELSMLVESQDSVLQSMVQGSRNRWGPWSQRPLSGEQGYFPQSDSSDRASSLVPSVTSLSGPSLSDGGSGPLNEAFRGPGPVPRQGPSSEVQPTIFGAQSLPSPLSLPVARSPSLRPQLPQMQLPQVGHLGLSDGSSTLSDRSGVPQSLYSAESTPPPMMCGRLSHQRRSPLTQVAPVSGGAQGSEVQVVAMQLANVLQAQQQFMMALRNVAVPPSPGHTTSSALGHDLGSRQSQAQLFQALQQLASQQVSGRSHLLGSRNPSSGSLASLTSGGSSTSIGRGTPTTTL